MTQGCVSTTPFTYKGKTNGIGGGNVAVDLLLVRTQMHATCTSNYVHRTFMIFKTCMRAKSASWLDASSMALMCREILGIHNCFRVPVDYNSLSILLSNTSCWQVYSICPAAPHYHCIPSLTRNSSSFQIRSGLCIAPTMEVRELIRISAVMPFSLQSIVFGKKSDFMCDAAKQGIFHLSAVMVFESTDQYC